MNDVNMKCVNSVCMLCVLDNVIFVTGTECYISVNVVFLTCISVWCKMIQTEIHLFRVWWGVNVGECVRGEGRLE